MKIKKKKPKTNRIERQIITGLIVNDRFVHELKGFYREGVLQSAYAQTIAGWCFDYYEQFQKAPKKEIEDIYLTHKENGLDQDQKKLIKRFLSSINDEYETQETFNVDYILKKAESHFRINALKEFEQGLSDLITGGDVDEAEAMISEFIRVARPETKGIDVLDPQVILSIFKEEKSNYMFSLPGDLGRTIGPFERGFLYAVVAPAKVGKTWWLMFFAIMAVLRGYNVLFVSCEMKETKMVKRIYHSFCSQPISKHAGELLLPVFDCFANQVNSCKKVQRACKVRLLNRDDEKPEFDEARKKYKPCTACRGTKEYEPETWFKKTIKAELTIDGAVKKATKMEKYNSFRGAQFKLVEFPSNTLTIPQLKTYMSNLEYYENFVPDVIITDYADKFVAENKNSEYRHQINEVWEGHKSIAQEKNCLMITASQSNTARSGKDVGQGDWADDIRKFNLVDGAFALNQSPEDKQNGLMRVGILGSRHDEFDLLSEVYVLESKKIARPYLDSCSIINF